MSPRSGSLTLRITSRSWRNLIRRCRLHWAEMWKCRMF
ncbi:MAG: hypothetical protein IJJ33_20550 [Victivallales bacterium]|nr:hypothetical protein [Victivallales bacterium]